MPIGAGVTGWVAQHGQAVRLDDALNDPQVVVLGERRPESMLVVPMVQEVVRGVIVVSAAGIGRFDNEDEVTLSIFASAAVQALINVENLTRLRRQQDEMELQLEGQRRPGCQRTTSVDLDPGGVLELIADSLKAIVPYDSLTVYQVDQERGTRRAVLARDRFADAILADESPLGDGLTGWVLTTAQAVLANDAHLDDRTVQVPNTPFEPESMMVVPLLVDEEAIGTLNVGRLGGGEAHFTNNEFELTKLFAARPRSRCRTRRPARSAPEPIRTR